MCDVTARSRRARTTPRPRWGILYGIATVVLTALAGVEFCASPGAEQTALRCGLALGGFAAMALWARQNRVALDQEAWCECAASKVSVRVIGSRRREPACVEEETLEEVVS
jgi:hypothetical protein